MSKALDSIQDYRLDTLRDMLSQCTEPQQALFAKCFPGGIDAIPENRIDGAITLCERTLAKNAADPDRAGMR